MRVTVLVIDSFGIGAMPDAERFGDKGANTALHICQHVAGDKWPTLGKLGLGNCAQLLGFALPGCPAVASPLAAFGAMAEKSIGKDTTTGHWEMAGIVLQQPFRTFPAGYPSFPHELIEAFEEKIGRETLGNVAASGTIIIQELGEQHLETASPIVYTSGDSVFQIAAHEEVIPVEELYQLCETARGICDPYRIARVIARPFVGKVGGFARTERRRDFSMPPPSASILEVLRSHGIQTVGIGKIGDIFCERGIDESYHDRGNKACLARTEEVLRKRAADQFIFVNLVDTDMIYGHRRDVEGYFNAVSDIDRELERILKLLTPDDILVITADHGCDPTFSGSDHTREYVPILWYQKDQPAINLHIRDQFADLAQSVASLYSAPRLPSGITFV